MISYEEWKRRHEEEEDLGWGRWYEEERKRQYEAEIEEEIEDEEEKEEWKRWYEEYLKRQQEEEWMRRYEEEKEKEDKEYWKWLYEEEKEKKEEWERRYEEEKQKSPWILSKLEGYSTRLSVCLFLLLFAGPWFMFGEFPWVGLVVGGLMILYGLYQLYWIGRLESDYDFSRLDLDD